MDDRHLKITLAVHKILSDWAEEYIKDDPLGSIAVSRFKRYRDNVRRDIQSDGVLQEKLTNELTHLLEQ